MTANPKENAKKNTNKHTGSFILIFIAAAAIIAGGYLAYTNKQKKAEDTTEQTNIQKINVVTTPASTRNFQQELIVQGNIEAKNFALVSPRIPGVIETIFADEGDIVTANETKLFQTDSTALAENLDISKHSLKVAEYAKQQAIANLEKTRADFQKAKLDYERFKRLLEKQSITQDAYEKQESQYLQLQATEKLSATQVDLADAQVEQARAALAIAQKNLDDTTIYAPISGKISMRLAEPGEMGSPGMPVLRIDDTALLEVSAFVPAQYYSMIISEQSLMNINASGINIGNQAIIYKSPTIQSKLRTFEIKCLINNLPEGITSGMMAQISVILKQSENLGVLSQAIQKRSNKSVVFIAENDKAREVQVETGIEYEGWTEIIKGDLKENDPVVTMGQDMIESGTPVNIRQENN